MYAACVVLCVVLLVIPGDVTPANIEDYETPAKRMSVDYSARRKPLEIDKKENQKLDDLLLLQGLDRDSTVKQKRSSNPKTISNWKLRVQQRRAETLCKFCRKSSLRMKRALCKRCAQIIPSTSSSRQPARMASKKSKNSALPQRTAAAAEMDTVPFKEKTGLLQAKRKIGYNEKFLLANTHDPKNSVKSNDTQINTMASQTSAKNVKQKLSPIKIKTINTSADSIVKFGKENETRLQKDSPNTAKTSDKNTLETISMPERKVTGNLVRSKFVASESTTIDRNSNIIQRIKLSKLKKKLFPSELNISNTKSTQHSNNIGKLNKSSLQTSATVAKPHILARTILPDGKKSHKKPNLNSKGENSNVSEFHSKLIKFPFSNKQIKRNLDSPLAMQRNLEQDNMRTGPKADRRKLLENSRKNAGNASEDTEKENVIENNKETVLSVTHSLARKTNLQKVALPETHESGTSNLENIRPKRLKAINQTSMEANQQQGQLESNKRILKFTGPRFIKKKSAFNINLNGFEVPLLGSSTETENAEKTPQTIMESLPLSRVEFSHIIPKGEKRKSLDELPNKSPTENDESPEIEIPAKNIQKFRRNNVILLKPDGASSITGSQGVIGNINNGKTSRRIQGKSGTQLKENVHLTEGEITMNDQATTEIRHYEKNIQTTRNPASDESKALKVNTNKMEVVKRSTTQGLRNSAGALSVPDKHNTSEASDMSLSVDQTTPQNSDMQLQTQHFLNRKVYLKHPRITSTYDDNKHKYVLKMAPKPPYFTKHKWNTQGMPISSTTSVVPTTDLHASSTNNPVLEEQGNSGQKTKVGNNENSDLRKTESEDNSKNLLTESFTKDTENQGSILNNQEENLLGVKKSKINTSNIGNESEHTDVIKHLRSQTFLNRNVYLKHPRLKSIIDENGRHKYVLKDPPNNSPATEPSDSRNTITELHSVTAKSIEHSTANTNAPEDNAEAHQIEKQSESGIVSRVLAETNVNERNRKSDKQLENSATTESVLYDASQTTESFNVNTHLRTQHFLNRKVYLKHPRLVSVYEDGQHKYILKTAPKPPYHTKHKWDVLGMPLTTSSTMNANTFAMNFNEKLTSTNHDSIPLKPNTLEDTEQDNFNQDDPLISMTENSGAEVSKEINSDDELENKEQDIFRRHLNMHPEINREKYKNLNIIYGREKELRTNSQGTNINIPRDISLSSARQEFLSDNARQHNGLEKQGSSQDENSSEYSANVGNLAKLKSPISAADTGQRSVPISFGDISPGQVHISDNKINLPMVLKQTENGKFQLVLDTSRMCNCSKCGINHYSDNNQQGHLHGITAAEVPRPGEQEELKPIFKRKLEKNLHQNPLHIFNILGQSNHLSATQINNFGQGTEDNKSDFNVSEQYARLLIENRLLAVFHSLNIPVRNVHEMDYYLKSLPDEEKQQLENYLLYTITNNSDEDVSDVTSNFSNTENQIKLKSESESTTEGNYRIQLKMSDEFEDMTHESGLQDVDIKTLIREEIRRELQKINKNHDNNKIQFMSDDSSQHCNKKKVVNKRHQDFFDENVYDSSEGANTHGLRNRKYRIVNNLLNWARDCIVKH